MSTSQSIHVIFGCWISFHSILFFSLSPLLSLQTHSIFIVYFNAHNYICYSNDNINITLWIHTESKENDIIATQNSLSCFFVCAEIFNFQRNFNILFCYVINSCGAIKIRPMWIIILMLKFAWSNSTAITNLYMETSIKLNFETFLWCCMKFHKNECNINYKSWASSCYCTVIDFSVISSS